jgi:hypothetical protein
LKYGNDPRWFYDLPRASQVDLLAVFAADETPKPVRGPLSSQVKVADSARSWWGV